MLIQLRMLMKPSFGTQPSSSTLFSERLHFPTMSRVTHPSNISFHSEKMIFFRLIQYTNPFCPKPSIHNAPSFVMKEVLQVYSLNVYCSCEINKNNFYYSGISIDILHRLCSLKFKVAKFNTWKLIYKYSTPYDLFKITIVLWLANVTREAKVS